MEDKKLKKKLAKVPDVDKNGDPIFKIADVGKADEKSDNKPSGDKNRPSK